MVRTLLLASSSASSSSDTTTTASRDSTGSSSSTSSFGSDLVLLAPGDSCDASRPSSVTDDDGNNHHPHLQSHTIPAASAALKKSKYFSLSRFSNVFKKDPKVAVGATTTNKTETDPDLGSNSVKRVNNSSSSAKDVIRKYLKKVKPLYEKLSSNQKQQQQQRQQQQECRLVRNEEPSVGATSMRRSSSNTLSYFSKSNISEKSAGEVAGKDLQDLNTASSSSSGGFPHSFSGNLKYGGKRSKRSYVASCPSSMRSSPSHSGKLNRAGLPSSSSSGTTKRIGTTTSASYDSSTMDELQSAIQGAIAHCKNSMIQSSNNGGGNKIRNINNLVSSHEI